MKTVLAVLRLISIILVTFFMLIAMLLESLFRGRSPEMGYRYAQTWARRMCRIVGLRIEVEGEIPTGGCIVMPNHRSYSDIFATLSLKSASFVARHDLRNWPLIGYAAELVGTIFVKRDSNESRKQTLQIMKEVLDAKHSITIYPEGTTFRGPGILDFKPGTFRLAAEGGFPVVPVALEYEYDDAAWVGNDTFVPHFIRIFGSPQTRLKLRYGKPLLADSGDELRRQAHAFTAMAVAELRKEWGKVD